MEARHNRGGNLPKPQVNYVNRPGPSQSYDESINYRPKGRPYPIEKLYKFQGQARNKLGEIKASQIECTIKIKKKFN